VLQVRQVGAFELEGVTNWSCHDLK